MKQVSKEHSIAVIPGDGIGREVIPEGVRVLEAVGAKHGLRFKWQEFPWSCDWYKTHGRMCPEDAPAILRKFDAVYFGAVGNPAIVFADEPTGALDSKTGREIIELLRELNSDGATLVIITHDRDLADALPRQVQVRDGEIVDDSAIYGPVAA